MKVVLIFQNLLRYTCGIMCSGRWAEIVGKSDEVHDMLGNSYIGVSFPAYFRWAQADGKRNLLYMWNLVRLCCWAAWV